MGAGACTKRIYFKITELPVLLFMVGLCYNFSIFVCGAGPPAAAGRTDMFNAHYTRNMVTTKIGKHVVEMYDTIDELPIVRFNKYQKLLLIDAGIGSDITGFDQRMEKVRRYLLEGKTDKAGQEIENVRQCFFFIQESINPQNMSLAALITKVDGQECSDISDDGLKRTLEKLQDASVKELTAQLDAVKKKIDGELTLYFPALFNDSDVKEYYDILRKRTLEILNGIVAGVNDPAGSEIVDKLTTALITYSNPKLFTGSDGVEIQFDRQFENLCLVLSEQLHVEPKKYTVLEFYNAFDFVKERAKEVEKAQKRAAGKR